MTSSSFQSLQTAIAAVERSLSRLDAAAEIAQHDRAQAAAQREAMQADISQSWEMHQAAMETDLAEAKGQADFLQADNQRLSNQLQHVQQEYLSLQEIAGQTVGRLDATVKQLDLILEH